MCVVASAWDMSSRVQCQFAGGVGTQNVCDDFIICGNLQDCLFEFLRLFQPFLAARSTLLPSLKFDTMGVIDDAVEFCQEHSFVIIMLFVFIFRGYMVSFPAFVCAKRNCVWVDSCDNLASGGEGKKILLKK